MRRNSNNREGEYKTEEKNILWGWQKSTIAKVQNYWHLKVETSRDHGLVSSWKVAVIVAPTRTLQNKGYILGIVLAYNFVSHQGKNKVKT